MCVSAVRRHLQGDPQNWLFFSGHLLCRIFSSLSGSCCYPKLRPLILQARKTTFYLLSKSLPSCIAQTGVFSLARSFEKQGINTVPFLSSKGELHSGFCLLLIGVVLFFVMNYSSL